MDRCKCSDTDIESIKTLLDFTKSMKKYDDDYYGYSKNHIAFKRPSDSGLWFYHSEFVKNCKLLNVPTFEQYMKKRTDYFSGPLTEEERLIKVKKQYKKEKYMLEQHNNVVVEVHTYMQQNNIKDEKQHQRGSGNEEELTTSQKLYVKFINEDRASRLKLQKQQKYGKYCFWLRDHLSVKDSGYGSIYSRDFPEISLEELNQLCVKFIRSFHSLLKF